MAQEPTTIYQPAVSAPEQGVRVAVGVDQSTVQTWATQNTKHEPLCCSNKSAFICIGISYVLAFICEQLTMEDRILGLTLGTVAFLLGFPAPLFILYPTIKHFGRQGVPRKSGFATRLIIGTFCYLITIIVTTILIMNAAHKTSSLQGLAIVCSSMLGFSGLIFYIDQP